MKREQNIIFSMTKKVVFDSVLTFICRVNFVRLLLNGKKSISSQPIINIFSVFVRAWQKTSVLCLRFDV